MDEGLELMYVVLAVFMFITAMTILVGIHTSIIENQRKISTIHTDYVIMREGIENE